MAYSFYYFWSALLVMSSLMQSLSSKAVGDQNQDALEIAQSPFSATAA